MQTFNQFATKNSRIDQDHAGLFCQVPSQDGNWYTVRCVESKTSVFASHCSCRTFSKKQHCSHVELVQSYWNRIYKVEPVVEVAPVAVEAPKVAKARKPRNGLVRKVRNGGLVLVAQPAPVAKIIEQSVQATLPTPKTTDISKKGNFGTKAFSLLR
jgi:hypothetical protein